VPPLARRPVRSRIATEALLLTMVIIWAGNYSLVKAVLAQVAPIPFNAVRLAMAALVFLAMLASSRFRGAAEPAAAESNVPGAFAAVTAHSSRISGRDWLALAGLGVIGHFVYQLGFIGGLARTSVANSALIIGCSPIAIASLTAAVGHERIGRLHWVGAAISLAGLYLVAGRGADLSGDSLVGDLMMLGAICCWSVYTVCSRPLLERHSPLVVTGHSMVFGAALFVAATAPSWTVVDWSAVTMWSWLATFASAVLALNLAYLIWYSSVQRLGNTRTSMYSNMVPVAAMLIASVGLGERIEAVKWLGAGAVIGGVLLTRIAAQGTRAAGAEMPPEE
jgi:drug/metabolite transporter (DMT)-like permease